MARREMGDIDRIVARRVVELRKKAGLSQVTLGAAIGVTFQQVQKYEHGKNRISAGCLYLIAEATGQPVQVFFIEEAHV